MKKLFSALFVLALFGAGCGTTTSTEPTNTQPTTTPDTVTQPVTTTPTPSAGPRALTAAQTDATWTAYVSKQFGFTLMTPTKGRYAPEWEVKAIAATDAQMKDGCFVYEGPDATSEMVNVGNTTFCHTSGTDNGAGQHYVLDSYSTQIGKVFAVIQFTKHTVNAANLNCTMPEPYSTSGSSCIPFVPAEYESTLDGIVGTFAMNAVTK